VCRCLRAARLQYLLTVPPIFPCFRACGPDIWKRLQNIPPCCPVQPAEGVAETNPLVVTPCQRFVIWYQIGTERAADLQLLWESAREGPASRIILPMIIGAFGNAWQYVQNRMLFFRKTNTV
jgi:hypothetical protein